MESQQASQFRRTPLKYLIMIALFITYSAKAIVIRHDVDDKKYRELGEQYSASVAYIRSRGCASTLIAPKWLLTAAHCVAGREKSITKATHLGDKYPIEAIVVHPQFDLANDKVYDIALIQLKKPILKGSPAKLYTRKNEQGKPVVFIGSGYFGNGLEGITKRNHKQRGATNTIIGVSEQVIKFKFDVPSKASHLEGISGPGDSGGPAFINIDSQLYVAGVSSYQVVNEFEEAHYGVEERYTRVSTYYPWIESVVNK
ncbi:trypsin-like serine protease [Alteromonadaceae bacterium M269]|nr:trypsin-like serine protease [Alteromonadaceae bacterium M269]